MNSETPGRYQSFKLKMLILALFVVISICSSVYILHSNMQKDIIFTDRGQSIQVTTIKRTVEGLIGYLGVELKPGDEIKPSLETVLKDGDEVVVTRAIKVTLSVDGSEFDVYTTKNTVMDVLRQADVQLHEKDRINPGIGSRVFNNTKINIVRVNEEFLIKSEAIPYQVISRKNSRMDEGTNRIVQQGQEGELEKRYLLVYENGIEVKRELVEESVVKEPTNRIVEEGTIKTFVTSRGETIRYNVVQTVEATGYCACPICTGKNSDGITASGTVATANRTIATADISWLPYGTRVYIPYYDNVFVVEDVKGNRYKGRRSIDIFFNTHAEARAFGRRNIRIYIMVR